MENFLYKIEKEELETEIKIKLYYINGDQKKIIIEDSMPYIIYIEELGFNSMNLISKHLNISNFKFKDKNDNNVLKIEIKNKELYQFILEECRTNSIKLFEVDLSKELRYLIENDISVYNAKNDDIPKLKYVSIDIETIGSEDNQEIIMISSYSPNTREISNVYVNTNDLKEDQFQKLNHYSSSDFKIIKCKDERDLLLKFKEDITEFDPDLIIGWNVIDFDFKVIRDRMKELRLDFNFSRIGELNNKKCNLKVFSDFFKDSYMDCEGILIMDIIQVLKSNFIVFEDYKLDTVSKEILKDEKIDLEETNEDFEESNSVGNKLRLIENMYNKNIIKLINYNFKDSLLVSKITEKLGLLDLIQKRSIITQTPIYKIKSPIATLDIMYLKELHKKKIVAESNFNFSDSNQITGAYVIEPEAGFYENIFVFDFKSLYPSIIMTFNIDPFTYIGNINNLENFNSNYNLNNLIRAPNGAIFTSKLGILPKLIKDIYKERDIAKKERDPIKSHALKITMNSFYGAMASPKSRFHNRDVGGAITSFGREILNKAKNFVERKGHKTVIYGDSVIGDTKIWIREKNKKKIKEIEISKLFEFKGKKLEEKQPDGTIKYYNLLEDIETLTMNDNYENEWRKLKYVMKHRTNKKMFKLHFNNQLNLTVTEDHSLIVNDYKKGLIQKKPEEIKSGIYNYGFDKVKNKKNENYLAQFLGFWIGNGYLDNNGYTIGISLGNDYEEFIKKVINNINILNGTKIYIKKKGDLNFSNIKLYSLMEEIGFKKNWISKTKKIPKYIFEQNLDFIYSFLKGMFSADGTIINIGNSSIIRYTSVNLDLIKDLQKLLMQVGIGSSYFKENRTNKYKEEDSKTYSYHLIINSKRTEFFIKNIGFIFEKKNKKFKKSKYNKKITVKHIIKKEVINNFNDFVYDIEVEDTHKFYGNNILLKNTDSIFVKIAGIDGEILENKKKAGIELEKELNEYFSNWVRNEFGTENYLTIEMEKLFSKFFIASKKRYVGYDEFSKETIFVGMEAIRGDWTQLAREFQKELVGIIFRSGNNDEIKQFILDEIKKLKSGKYDDKLVYTKKITKPLSEYTKTTPPHVKAARGVENFQGRIVKYVMLKEGPTHISIIEKLSKLGKPINYDYEHYIEKQLNGVSDDLLKQIGLNFNEIIKNNSQSNLNKFF